MNKILVTSDFSDASRYAWEYAKWLELKTQATLVALHVQPEIRAEETVGEDIVRRVQEKDEKLMLQKLKKFTTPYPHNTQVKVTPVTPIRCIVRTGHIADQIIRTGREEEADLIIVGTRAKHHLWEHLLGSVTTSLIARSPIHVLVVPEGAKYKDIRNIAFATELSLQDAAVFSRLDRFAGKLGATVHRVFVNTLPSEQEKLKEEVIDVEGELKKNSPETSRRVTMIRESTVIKGIDYYLEKHPSEMVALYAPHRGFPESILHRSVSKRLAYHAHLPLLVMKDPASNE
jgi:nucleotide-binding universal stress UspA family protein